ncbi:hypothetical protein E2562_033308 [Oryza meyeriana var. granulata]|uniref:Uncharacterized protein n=1 Tax=Oryza meyeriana var. granulata TaxID=110450 RepID=A0A6G1F0Z2_9ORYZ|nr:hypothetical protein E2562_033306 [Oryza meyeriana var. granulata]KAF0930541.1 hypothetical protein E2562_033308 [Oryza meyeriana var. granulata]
MSIAVSTCDEPWSECYGETIISNRELLLRDKGPSLLHHYVQHNKIVMLLNPSVMQAVIQAMLE